MRAPSFGLIAAHVGRSVGAHRARQRWMRSQNRSVKTSTSWLGEQRRHLLAHGVVGDVGRRRSRRRRRRGGRGGRRRTTRTRRPGSARRAIAAYAGQLLGVGRIGVGDLEVRRPVEVDRHRPLRRRAEDRPAQVGGDEPGEVVVQRRHLRVGAGVGEVDRPPLAVLAQRLAGVELPAEERVDRQRRVDRASGAGRRGRRRRRSCSDRAAAPTGRSARVGSAGRSRCSG